MLWCQWVSATRAKWGWEHDKCQKWHCRKMRAGASFSPGESSLLKERDKHCVSMLYVCEREKSSSAPLELCLCYSDNGAVTQMKKIFSPPLSDTFIFPSLTVSVSAHISLTFSDSPFVYLSISLLFSHFLLSSLAALSCFYFVIYSLNAVFEQLKAVGEGYKM